MAPRWPGLLLLLSPKGLPGALSLSSVGLIAPNHVTEQHPDGKSKHGQHAIKMAALERDGIRRLRTDFNKLFLFRLGARFI